MNADTRRWPERANDAVWGWAMDRVRRKYDPFWIVARGSYLLGKLVDASHRDQDHE